MNNADAVARYSYITHAVQKPASYPMGETDGSHLSPLERSWLEQIPSNGWEMTAKPQVDYMTDTRTPAEKAAHWTPTRLGNESAVIVYVGEFGVAMGAVRCRRPEGYAGRTEDSFEVSPFPGGWEEVGISRILLVRHPNTI